MNPIANGNEVNNFKSTFSPFDKSVIGTNRKRIATKAAANRMIGEDLGLSLNSIVVLQKGHLMLMI